MSDPNTPPEYPAAPGSSDDTARAAATPPPYPANYRPAPRGADDSESMTTAETLSGIFFEPGRTFAALRSRPRFLVAAVIIFAGVTALYFLLYQKVSYETIMRRAVETNRRTADMPAEQREQVIRMQTSPVFQAIAKLSPGVFIVLLSFVGAALYLLGSMAMGSAMSYWQALSVWVYSALPPTVIFVAANLLLLFLKAADDITPEDTQRGFARANLGVLFDPTARPVMTTLFGLVDFFSIYGLFLAAVGVRKMTRLSSGASWAVVLIVWTVGAVLRVAMAAAFGQAMA